MPLITPPTGTIDYANDPLVSYDEVFRLLVQQKSMNGILSFLQDDPLLGDTDGIRLQWTDRKQGPRYSTITADLTANTTTVVVADSTAFKPNDLLHVDGNIFETMRVSSITDATHIVVERGFGATDPTQAYLAVSTPILKRDVYAEKEGGDGQDNQMDDGDNRINDFWLIKKNISVTRTNERVRHHGGLNVGQKLNIEAMAMMANVIQEWERLIINGENQQMNKTTVGSCKGIIQMILQHSSNGSKFDLAGNPLSTSRIQDCIERIADRGGAPNTIILHPTRVKALANEVDTKIQIQFDNTRLGPRVASIWGLGEEVVEVFQERAIDKTTVVVMDRNKLTRCWRSRMEMYDANAGTASKVVKTLEAEVSLKFTEAGESGEVLYNVGA